MSGKSKPYLVIDNTVTGEKLGAVLNSDDPMSLARESCEQALLKVLCEDRARAMSQRAEWKANSPPGRWDDE